MNLSKTLMKPSSLALVATAGAGYYYYSQNAKTKALPVSTTKVDADAQKSSEQTAMYIVGGLAAATAVLYFMKK